MDGFTMMLVMNGFVIALTLLMILRGQRAIWMARELKYTGVQIREHKILPIPDCFRDGVKGYKQEDFLWQIFIPAMCILGLLKNLRHWRFYLMLMMASVTIKVVRRVHYKRNRKMEFNKNAYRLYKFLHNQISAGVQPKESMTSLYRIVKEPFLRERLQALGSIYAQTLDFDMAFEEIANYYEGADVNSFRIAIIQGIDLGDNLNTLKKQEGLMFSKYMNYLQLETNRQKARTFVVVTIYCLIIIFMIGLPLMMELSDAIDMIFMK